jgi:hypothetical protein
MLHPVIQKIGNRLPGWKRKLMPYPGRKTLIKTILTVMPTSFLTMFKMKKWTFSKIDKLRRNFLWKGHDSNNMRGGHYLVNWQRCVQLKKCGGLEIKVLEKFSRPLRLRWLLHRWDNKEWPWKHLLKITDGVDIQLFFTSTIIQIGNGNNTPSRRQGGHMGQYLKIWFPTCSRW